MNRLGRRFPVLPDSDESSSEGRVKPHSDGRAWKKACPECAFRTCDPQEVGQRYQSELRAGKPGTVFYCIHREDDRMHRVCACYAAIHREQALEDGE